MAALEVQASNNWNELDKTVHNKNIHNNIYSKGNECMDFKKAILLAMIEASYKDKIIDEETYQKMKQYVM